MKIHDDERATVESLAERIGCSRGRVIRAAIRRLGDAPVEELRVEIERLPNFERRAEKEVAETLNR